MKNDEYGREAHPYGYVIRKRNLPTSMDTLKYTIQQLIYLFVWCFIVLTFIYGCIVFGNNIKRFLIIKNANIKNLEGHRELIEEDFCRNSTKRLKYENLGYDVCLKAEQEYMKNPWTNAFQIFYEELSAIKTAAYIYKIISELFDFVFRKEFFFCIMPFIPSIYRYAKTFFGYVIK